MQEFTVWFDNLIHHAVAMWMAVVVITLMCAAAAWAVNIWARWYRACFSSKKEKLYKRIESKQ